MNFSPFARIVLGVKIGSDVVLPTSACPVGECPRQIMRRKQQTAVRHRYRIKPIHHRPDEWGPAGGAVPEAAENLEFEEAARLRDEIKELREDELIVRE